MHMNIFRLIVFAQKKIDFLLTILWKSVLDVLIVELSKSNGIFNLT